MAGSAVRLAACAGLLATGLVMGGVGAGIAGAEPGDATAGGPEGASVFGAMQPQPHPTPAPGPAFRTREEEGPPVADSGGGGLDPLSTGVAAEPPVLQAPMVIAPLPIRLPPGTAPATAPVTPVGASARAGPTQAIVADAAAGATAPVIRGSLPPTVQPATRELTPMSGQATQLGYPRVLRNPTVGELAALALPGVAGLLLCTFSGGFIGYRQANSARHLRAQGAERFLR